MIKIIPAILSPSYRGIEHSIEAVASVADTIQIDFVDGYLAHNKTWWFSGKDEDAYKRLETEEVGLPYWDTMNYEFDLMIKDPLLQIDKFLILGPSKIIFHLGSVSIEELVKYFETMPEVVRTTITFGVALGLDDDATMIAPLMPYINTIQCMGIAHIGAQGQLFDERVFAQIARVRELYPDKTISVDGGITREHIPQLIQSGVHVLMVGSLIFGNMNPSGILVELQSLCQSVINISENLK